MIRTWAARHPRRAALMAAAGPAGNFALAALAFTALKVGIGLGWFFPPATAGFDSLVEASTGTSVVTTMLSIFLMLNVLLGTFNLLPLPPLDGGAVLSAFLPDDARNRLRELTSSGAASLLGLVVAWKVFQYMSGPLFSVVLQLLHPQARYG